MLIKMPVHLSKWGHGAANSFLLLDKMVRLCSERPSVDNRKDEHQPHLVSPFLLLFLKFPPITSVFARLSLYSFISVQPKHSIVSSHLFPRSGCSFTLPPPPPPWLSLLPLANNFARNIKGKSSISFTKPSLFAMYPLTTIFISTQCSPWYIQSHSLPFLPEWPLGPQHSPGQGR